jgi:hypothetical protein
MSSTPTHQGYNQAPSQGQAGPYTNSHHAQNPNNNGAAAGSDPSGNKLNGDSDSAVQFAVNNGFQTHCGCLECYHPATETLDYDYTSASTNNMSSSSSSSSNAQQPARIRERGEFYIDSFNDQPWNWSFGTNEMVSSCCSSACDATR